MPRPPSSLSSLWERPYLLLITASAMWGANTIFSRLVAGEVSPMMMTFLRWAIVSAMVWPLAVKALPSTWPKARPKLLHILLMALSGFVGNNAFIYFAAYHTSAVNMAIFQGAMPIFVMAGAVVLLGIRIMPQQIAGILLAICGVAAIALKGDIATLLHMNFNIGDIYMLIAALCYAGYTLLLRTKPALPGFVFFALLSTCAALGSLPFVIYEYVVGIMQFPTAKGWIIIAVVAVFPSFVAQLSFIRGVELIGPPRAGLFTNLVPVFGSLFAVIFLREAFLIEHAIGLVLVLAGIWLAERK